ncbi:MAG: His-Xaa-Ser system radical SAM maturase HxsB [Elusimicrobia bacterium HGW-Elusimicrobia-3]|jgi:His-Xaa-Ser system radical SAM maturase HxsB|nr:MAG: His-Xaa-Ser system radical SAM maturase HxsB [Elusimicrobia bacterium HGW-Elusimicrobia-3]
MAQRPATKKSAERAALPHFNFRRLSGGAVLLTNDSGTHASLSGAQFRQFRDGRVAAGSALYKELSAKGFVRDMMDMDGYAAACAKKNSFLGAGPGLHILVLTLRCNHKCVYCQSSAVGQASRGTDMSPALARKCVDFALKSTNPGITIEFQGGEPLLNWEALKASVLHARRRAKEQGREVRLALVSNFSLMTEEKARFLLANEVSICTSLDGPADLHDKNRVFAGGGSHAAAVKWLKYFSAAYKKQVPEFRTFKPSALLTVSRYSLGREKQIVDEYVRLGLEDVFLRPLAPIGFAKQLWDKVGYAPEEFLSFYRAGLDYILKLNARGVTIRERNAVMMLEKILNGTDPGYLDMRCPCGAVIGQLAYNYNGDIYACDEGRMVGWQGDDLFKAGNVARDPYSKVMLSQASRACASASSLDTQPQCSRCAYKPFCGVCPVYNYETQGSLSGEMPSNGRCALFMGLFDTLFSLLAKPASAKILKGWVSK